MRLIALVNLKPGVASEAVRKVAAAFEELADAIFLTTEPVA